MQKIELVLEGGEVFSGFTDYKPTLIQAEVVFHTGMNGYVEALTDPSYQNQILMFTWPVLGNYGVRCDPKGQVLDAQSEQIWPQAVLVQQMLDYVPVQGMSLRGWLKKHHIPLIEGIDTRKLSRVLVDRGPVKGTILTGASEGLALKQPEEDLIRLGGKAQKRRILLIDYGVKQGILDALYQRGLEVLICPQHKIKDLSSFQINQCEGILLSNGPGNPQDYILPDFLVRSDKPVLGICLGCQILGLFLGGRIKKMQKPHRSLNEACIDLISGKAVITSQNHGFELEALPDSCQIWFCNLKDRGIEGFLHRNHPWMGVQFHPEGSPGPEDTSFVFDAFWQQIQARDKERFS